MLADILHFTGGNEKAHKLYNEILEAKIPKDKPATIAIEHLIGFDGDILNSPKKSELSLYDNCLK